MMDTTQTSSLPKNSIKIEQYKPREQKWIWNYLKTNRLIYKVLDIALPPPTADHMDKFLRLGYLTKVLETLPEDFNFERVILPAMKSSLISEDGLKWIEKENYRLLIWAIVHLRPLTLDQYSTKYFDDKFPCIGIPASILADNRHEKIINAIDTWQITRVEKMDFLLNKKIEWIKHKTSDKEIKWLDPKDEGQLIWAWEYLTKQRKNLAIPDPTDMREYNAAVLASLDEMSYGYPSDKKLFMEQMKRTWSQKKFRDSGKAKKPYYLPLTIKTREKLQWLAENSGQKPSEILEQLIQESHEKANKGC